MRIVITGRQGQVVRSLLERASVYGVEVVALGRPELDLSGPVARIVGAIERARPQVVVSAAAYTQVDSAESEPELAYAVNETGARAVALGARAAGAPLIHLSTDYVFDGSKQAPYSEDDPPHPTGVYGWSKLAGEHAVLAEHKDAAVLRTAWVYSPFGANFAKTVLRLAGERDHVAVVADQIGNPTSALDIADTIIAVATNLLGSEEAELRGVFHMAGGGEATWAQFAERIFAASAAAGGPTATVRPISTADYRTAASRPKNSRLDSSKLARAHGVRLRDWRQPTEEVVRRLLQSAG